jgi:hypothetical protein
MQNVKHQVDGHNFDSKKEAGRYHDLKLLQMAGEIRYLEVHPVFPIDVNGKRICTYEADFRYELRGRSTYGATEWKVIVEDVKSDYTRTLPVYRLKNKLMEAVYGIAITEYN